MDSKKQSEYQWKLFCHAYQSDSFYNVRQHISECQNYVQSLGNTNRFAKGGEQTLCTQLPSGTSWGELHEIRAESVEQKRAGAMDAEIKAQKKVPDFCVSLAKGVLRLVSTGRKMQIKKWCVSFLILALKQWSFVGT